jgi:glucose-1-phosphatase
MSTQIKNIILDFGGVLFDIDYHAPHREFTKLGWSEFNIDYSQAAQNEIYDLLEIGAIEPKTFWDYLTSKMPGVPIIEIEKAWNSILLHPISHRIEKLHLLKSKYRTCLLSNTNAIHAPVFERMMQASGEWQMMLDNFDAIHYSHDIKMRKPHPETFLHVCQLHHFRPEETIFVDDSIQHVKGAIEAGLIGLHLTPSIELFELLEKSGVTL